VAVSFACAQSYTAVDLGAFIPTAINDAGTVVGDNNSSGNAFAYSNGTLTNLGLGQAFSINDAGTIAGSYNGVASTYSNGTWAQLGVSSGTASGINNTDTVVGKAATGKVSYFGFSENHAFSYSNGIMTDLGTLGGTDSSAYAININGTIVGSSYTNGYQEPDHAFSYSNGHMTDLGTLGGSYSYAYGINNAGTIAGEAYTAYDLAYHAFSYSNGIMTDLGTLGGNYSLAHGINNSSTIVGEAAGGNGYRAFVDSNGIMTDLNTVLHNDLGGAVLIDADGINDLGQIVAFGVDGGSYQAYLLTPNSGPPVLQTSIPEPSTCAALLGAAALGFATLRRKQMRSRSSIRHRSEVEIVTEKANDRGQVSVFRHPAS